MTDNTPKLSVIVSTYNRPKYLMFIAQMLRKQEGISVETIVSDDGTQGAAPDPSLVDLYLWRRDDGFHKGWCINQAIQMASSEFCIFLDDDTLPKGPQWALGHYNTLLEHDVSRGPFHIARLNNEGIAVKKHSQIFGLPGTYYATTNTGMRRDTFIELGGLDDAFDGYYGYEDVDLGIRIKRAGLKVGYTGDDSVAVHVGKPYMFDENEQEDTSLNKRNARVMEEKWGAPVDELMQQSALE